MKPPFRSGKGLPGIGGARCSCCKTGMTHAKNRRLIRHREKASIGKQIKMEKE